MVNGEVHGKSLSLVAGRGSWLLVVDQTRQWAAQVTWPSTDFGGKSPCCWWWPVAGPVLGQVAFSDSLLTRLQTDPRLPACCHHQLIRKSTRFGPGGTKLCTKATKPDKNVWHFCYRLISSEPWLQLLIDKPRPGSGQEPGNSGGGQKAVVTVGWCRYSRYWAGGAH